MRGPWTPIRISLTRSPKIRELARSLRCDSNAALGLAVRWLAYVTEQCTSSDTRLSEQDLDEELRCPGLASALERIDWVYLDTTTGTLHIVDYGKHSNERVLHADRQGRYREKVTQEVTEEVTPAPSPEKSRIEKTISVPTAEALSSSQPGVEAAAYPVSVSVVMEALALGAPQLATEEQRTKCAQDFLATMTASNWRDNRNRQIQNWRFYLCKFAKVFAAQLKEGTPAAKSAIRNPRLQNSNATHLDEY